MQETQLVSIIIPCYNAADYISDAIQSAISQTHPNCEIVVVDDGSTDDSLKIIKSFGSKVTWEAGPNRGAGMARNRGIEIACGDWIQFLDSDDTLLPNCVRSKLEEPRQEGEIICSSLTLMDGYPEHALTYFWKFPSYDHVAMIKHGTPQTAAPLHSKNDLTSIGGFSAGLPVAEEYDLHLRLAFGLNRRFRVIDSPGVAIRPQPNSLSRGNTGDDYTSQVLSNLYQNYNASFSPEARRAFGEQAGLIARMFYRNGESKDAFKWVQLCELLADGGMRSAYRSEIVATLAKCMGYHRFEIIHSFVRKFRKQEQTGRK